MMAKWYEKAFGAVADEVGAAIADARAKLVEEGVWGRKVPEPAPKHDQSPQNDPSDGYCREPTSPTPYPEAPVHFYDLPSDKQAPAPPEQEHDIDR